LDFPDFGPQRDEPGFSAPSEPFSYAYFAAGNISVGFTPKSQATAYEN
jgi:YD repeat-containing protein